jgi:hypothetical protein
LPGKSGTAASATVTTITLAQRTRNSF